MIGLSRPFLQISDGKSLSYGGSQMRSDNNMIRKCGCGPVAALDLCAYLEGRDRTPIPLEEYNRELERLCAEAPEILEMHGFYADGEDRRVMFDLVVDFAADGQAVCERVRRELEARWPDHRFDIVLDSDFSD